MDLKVDYDELTAMCTLSDKNSEDLRKEIEYWQAKLNELQEIWSGSDATAFFKNAGNYIKRMNVIPNTYDALTNFMKNANREYNVLDNESRLEFEQKSQEDVMEEYV